MPRYVWSEGAWVLPDAVQTAARSLAIQSDFAEPMLCHADGRMHSSRSTYDAAVRAAGCEIVGKTEARKLQQKGAWHGRSGMEPVQATLKRILREMGE